MVTVKEIEQREEEIKGVEKQAQTIASEKVPQRRFGSGVTLAQQKNVLQRKREAKQTLTEIKSYKVELSSAKKQARAFESQQAEIAKLQALQNQYEQGRKLALSGRSAIGLSTKAQKQGFKDAAAGIRSQKDYDRQISKLKAEGLKPVVVNNKIVGFEDSVRKLSIPIENIPGSLTSQSAIDRYQRAGVIEITKTEQLQSIPTYLPRTPRAGVLGAVDKLRNRRDRNIIKKLNAAGLPGSPEYIAAYKREANPFTSSRLGLYNVLGFGGKTQLIDETGRPLNVPPIKDPGPNVLQLAALGVGSSPAAFSRIPATYSTRFVGTLQRGRAGTRVAIFSETRAIAGRSSESVFSISQQVLKNFGKRNVGVGGGYTFQIQRALRVPSGRIITKFRNISPFATGSVGQKLGTASVIRQLKNFRVGVKIPRAQSGLIRSGTVTKGQAGIDKDIFALVTQRANNARNIIKVRGGTPRLRINRKTGDLSFVIRQPNIKGIVVETPKAVDTGVKFLQPANIKKTPLSLTFQEEKAFQDLVSGAVSASQKALKTPPIPKVNVGKLSVLAGVSVGVSSRTGDFISDYRSGFSTGVNKALPKVTAAQKERTNTAIQQLPSVKLKDLTLPKVRSLSSLKLNQQQRNLQIQQPLLSQIPKLQQTPRFKQIQRQRPLQKIQTPRVKAIPRQIPKTKTPFAIPKIPKLDFNIKTPKANPQVQGFRPFVIKKGEKFFLGGLLPKGQALKKAETAALKSLRATFGAEPTRGTVRGKDISYKPPKDLFRGFRIKQGKRIPLQNTFIQRQTKRLNFGGEIREIQRARRISL